MPVVSSVAAQASTSTAPGAVVIEAAELRRLLNELDGQLGLAVYRGEGADPEWKLEAMDLIGRIRAVLRKLGD